MYAAGGALDGAGPGASVLVLAVIVFLYAYLHLLDPVGPDEGVPAGVQATGVSLLLVFLFVAAVNAYGI